ncbi:MAG: DUF177 domain-containing protein [Oscillospiraceae bacterium]|nr:DUF177 domain-containing protein [Oscillospiraceae bacterium]
MTLDVSRALQQPGEQFPFSAAMTDAEKNSETDRFPEGVDVRGVRADGIFVGGGDTVFVRGRACAEVLSKCARCLADVTQTIETPVHEVYGTDADPDDPERRRLEGYEVDLTDAVYSALALSLPIRFLCREDCKGLCPVCGFDLNEGDCGCVQKHQGI